LIGKLKSEVELSEISEVCPAAVYGNSQSRQYGWLVGAFEYTILAFSDG
jgi:hypothetical protein